MSQLPIRCALLSSDNFCFLVSKTCEIHVKASITVKVVGRISSYNCRKMEKSGLTCFFIGSFVSESKYSRISVAQTPLGP